ncbi:MAG: lipoate--protein ligase, partial [Bacteroidota bacterium]
MFLFISPDKNPYFNLASEELLFNKRDENFLLIYRNFPSVIIGKHQNPYIEADLIYLKTKNIMLARRLSGGGSVYHDEGNINFCFIQTVESEKKINFDNYTKQIISFLKYIGLNIEVNEKDDILLDNKKISGNAQHINKNRVLHHGTLLFSSDLDQLRKSLNPKNPDKYITHASKSVKSRVTNILCNDPKVKNIDNFQNMLEEFLTKKMELKKLNFSESEIIAIKKQVRQKYQTWEWIFGYSPHYSIDIKD